MRQNRSFLEYDRVRVTLIAGSGGRGVVAWRREKFVPKGGPCGGNGGSGGSIYLQADSQVCSLKGFLHRRIIKGKNGQPGGSNCRTGKQGSDLILKVPQGTLVRDVSTNTVLCDFIDQDQIECLCRGGAGGRGNHSFKSSTYRAPYICTAGKAGQVCEIELELKLIADVGLLGMPNAGKSSLISAMTQCEAKIGAYPFTTLAPNLGYFNTQKGARVVVADIPGIIENASVNRGLGFEFLRHVERSSLLVYVIDISGEEGRNPCNDFQILRQELKKYHSSLLEKPFIVVLNKVDLESAAENITIFQKKNPSLKIILTSALHRIGIDLVLTVLEELMDDVKQRLAKTGIEPATQGFSVLCSTY